MSARDGSRGSDFASLLQSSVAKAASSASAHDQLTGLPNRMLFGAILEAACAGPDHQGIGLLRLTIDDVGALREDQGHATADALLLAVAGRLRRSIRTGDVAAKAGDSDFSLVLAADDVAEVACAAQRILERLREPYEVSGTLVDVTVSIGIAYAMPGSVTATQLLERAEIALERARSTGRGEWKIYKPSNGIDPDTQASMVADLRAALQNNEMTIALYPVVALDSIAVTGADAVLQWDHPKIGRIASTDFLPVLADAEAARLLADWTITAVCTIAARHDLSMSLSLDVTVVPNDALAERVASSIAASGINPANLWIGVPEGAFVTVDESGLRALERIRAMGARVLLDDFSNGPIALDQLRALPIDGVRTAPSVIAALETDIHAFAWVQGLTGLARSLRISVCARGVGTVDAISMLGRFGVGYGQGPLLGGVMTTREITDYNASGAPLAQLPGPGF
jgi:diguanylate cyclase (GGDEF)-like protein